MTERQQKSYDVRLKAAELARSRQYPEHKANGDEQKYAGDKYFMSFTKGLPHNPNTGLIQDAQDFVEFRRAIDDGFIDPFSERVRHGAKFQVNNGNVEALKKDEITKNFRQWEAPTAGVVFDLEGPDAQAVTIPPAPPLIDADGEVNQELVFEMAEVYELAILRDQPFNAFEGGSGDEDIQASIRRLNQLEYIENQTGRPRKTVERRRRPEAKLSLQTVFRGSSPGVEVGPYISQFLLIGNTDRNQGGSVAEGKITYGVQQIDQKVPVAEPKKDFMTTMDDYVLVQRGIKPDPETYVLKDGTPPPKRPVRRFISTPRDLATYVHYDALYQAYLNACIILLGMETPFDPGFDHLSGVGAAAGNPDTRRNAGGFALYGGPHILNLVTEVSTRALKAVRFQKFNNHIRLRPEALAARIELVRQISGKNIPPNLSKEHIPPALIRDITKLKEALESNKVDEKSTLAAIEKLTGNYFLPMAFPEGSPMHPAYGAGHATVAGACVTILKAFFDTSAVLVKTKDKKDGTEKIVFKRFEKDDERVAFRAPEIKVKEGEILPSKSDLDEFTPDQFLTLEGELNKLAANISIGRNMAGVHYFSDYYDSVRMGEEIAIGILEEQALTYPTDPFVLSVPTFDGDVVRIGAR